MSRVDDMLPKKLKLKKMVPQQGPSNILSVSIPASARNIYFSKALMEEFVGNKVKRFDISYSTENDLVAIEPNSSGEYKVPRDIGVGNSTTCHVGEHMPPGKYVFVEEDSEPGLLVFSRLVITSKNRNLFHPYIEHMDLRKK